MHDDELRHRFGSTSRFRCDDEERAREIQPAEQCRNGFRVDVVEDLKSRVPGAGFFIQHVPTAWPQRCAQRYWPKSGAADSEDDDVVVAAARLGGKSGNLLEETAIIGKVHKAYGTGRSQRIEAALGIGELLSCCSPRFLIDSPRGDHHI